MGQDRLGGVGPLAVTGHAPIVNGERLKRERLPRTDGTILPAGTGNRLIAHTLLRKRYSIVMRHASSAVVQM